MLKTKTWILIFSVMLTLSLGAARFLSFEMSGKTNVQILQDGICIEEINLSRIKAPYKIKISDKNGGSNTVLVEPGRIRVIEADCPDQICVKRGWLSDRSSPIVCLPHRLVIRMTGESEVDAVVD